MRLLSSSAGARQLQQYPAAGKARGWPCQFLLGEGTMVRYFFYLVVACALCANAALARLPNHTRTPGVTNPDVTQETIHQTICVSGWTATSRAHALHDVARRVLREADPCARP